ncbi:MAG: aspartate-semialdehyde dehydrogenase [Candidatus Dormibacteria bacterium]
MRESAPRVAVVGATGAAGSTLLRVLCERAFPMADLRVFASERSEGARVTVGEAELTVHAVSDEALRDADIVFLAAGGETARRFAPYVAEHGGVAVDKSSAYRQDPQVPLVVPEVNAGAIAMHRGIVANPNCVTTPLTITLAPLQRAFGLRQVTLATYQAASGAGRALRDELDAQARDDAAGREPRAEVYPHVLLGNVVPGGWPMYGADTEEEVKVIAESRKVLDMAHLRVSITTVRVPVAVAHSAAVFVELEQDVEPDVARAALRDAPGIVVVDDPAAQRYPTPRDAAGSDSVYVGRIRRDTGRDNGIAFFFSADNLRKGAATNAVQVAELLLAV